MVAQHPKTRPSDLVLASQGVANAVQLADTTFSWWSGARAQGAKPPGVPQSQSSQLKQARKPKGAQAKPLKCSNPKANLKKGGLKVGGLLKPNFTRNPCPGARDPTRPRAHKTHPKFAASPPGAKGVSQQPSRRGGEDKKGKWGGQQQLCEQTATDKFPSKRPHGISHGASGRG